MSHKGESSVAKAVQEAAKSNNVSEPLYKVYNPCTPSDITKCNFATGLEGSFVSDIASRVHRLLAGRKEELKFHECTYFPSTRIERKCGFDVSLGHFERKNRVRLMHKLIKSWCDTDWVWNSDAETYQKNGAKIYRCAEHIAKLVQQSKLSHGHIRPYLSFSVCFCLHEHRRMGREDIPCFEDEQRSLFIDLSPLVKLLDAHNGKLLEAPKYSLRVEHRPKDGGITSGWYLKVKKDKYKKIVDLPVFSWKAFSANTVEFLLSSQ